MRNRAVIVGVGIVAIAAGLVLGQLFLSRRAPVSAPQPQAGAALPSASVELTSLTGVPGRIPPLPGGKPLASAKPTGPVPTGFRLHPLSSAPDGLISGFTDGRIPAGSAYSVTVRPWGYGPADRVGQTVVVSLGVSKPEGAAPELASMVRAPLLAIMDTRKEGTILVGGPQRATLTFMSNAGRVIPVLSNVTPAE